MMMMLRRSFLLSALMGAVLLLTALPANAGYPSNSSCLYEVSGSRYVYTFGTNTNQYIHIGLKVANRCSSSRTATLDVAWWPDPPCVTIPAWQTRTMSVDLPMGPQEVRSIRLC